MTTLGAALSTYDIAGDRPSFRAGGTFYYCGTLRTAANTVLVQNTLYCTPFYVNKDTTFATIGVVSTGVALSSARLGIYSDTNGVPSALVLDAGSVGTTGGAFASISISQALTVGWYWLACAVQGANGNIQCITAGFQVPTTAPFSAGTLAGYTQTGISGALPSPWGATLNAVGTSTLVWLSPA